MFNTYVLIFEIYSYQAVIQGERCLFQIDLVAAWYVVFIVTLISLLLFVLSMGGQTMCQIGLIRPRSMKENVGVINLGTDLMKP